MKRRQMWAVFALLVGWCAGVSSAQTPANPLVTDRPDFTESSITVGRGVVQIEGGTTLEFDGHGTDKTHLLTVPQALVRIGVSKSIELRIGSEGWLAERVGRRPDAISHGGVSDVELGFKAQLTSQEDNGFDTAIVPSVSLPTGSDRFSSGGVDPSVIFGWARDVGHGFALSGNFNLASITGDADSRFTQGAFSVSAGHDLVAGFAGYWEIYALSALEKDGSGAWTVNTGVTRAIGPNMQFDVLVGRGISATAANWFVGGGLAIRRLSAAPRE